MGYWLRRGKSAFLSANQFRRCFESVGKARAAVTTWRSHGESLTEDPVASVAVAECGRWGHPPVPALQATALRSRDSHLGSPERRKEAWALGSVAFRRGYLHRTSDARVLPRGRENPVKTWLLLRLERCPFFSVWLELVFGGKESLRILEHQAINLQSIFFHFVLG